MRNNITRPSARTLVSFAVLVGYGPRDELRRVLVSGEVTYGGQPVAIGQIRFIPMPGTNGPTSVERIVDEKYTTSSTGGVPVGKHRVEIASYDPEEYANRPMGPGTPPIRQLLPEKYNRESLLEATVESGKRKATLDYQLER